MQRCIPILLFVALAGCKQPNVSQPSAERLEPVEGFPQDRLERMKKRDEILSAARPGGGVSPRFVITLSKRWNPGGTVKVAFRGGTTELHRQIAQIAATWTRHGNVGLDFGYDAARGYRSWAITDSTPTAEIRIAFDAGGYWSCVGTDSLDPACARPGETSLNLSGFDTWKPANWQAVVLHEFGHALGFQHEHQNPQGGCDAEFRWDDDPGYVATRDSFGQFIKDSAGRRPGIYTVLGGPPNCWSRQQIDFNLRQLLPSSAFDTSELDKLSIMKYEFPDWMYRNGTQSRCYSTRNDDLSPLDQVGMLRLYPRQPSEILSAAAARNSALTILLAVPGLPVDQKQDFDKRRKAMASIR